MLRQSSGRVYLSPWCRVNSGPQEMLWKLLLLLTLVPIAELYLLLKLTDWTDIKVTLLVILGTGVMGAILARAEGLRVVRKMQRQVAGGEIPANSLLDGVLILVAGALLLTPGILTDAAGFVLLLPPSRALIRNAIKRWFKRKVERGQVTVFRRMGFGSIREKPPPGAPPTEDDEDDDMTQ